MRSERKMASFERDQSGAIAIFAAAALPMVVGCLALAVDLGSVYLERRTAQGMVDLAAINAAAYPDTAEAAARSSLAANGQSFKRLLVEKGHYSPDASIDPHQRFKAGLEPFNAVRVALARDARLAFAAAFMSSAPEFSVAATAAISHKATYSVGTRVAALRGGIVNDTLSALAGTRVELSVMDYEALLAADVEVHRLLNAVSLRLGLTGITYDELLRTRVSLAVLGGALRDCLAASGSQATAAAMDLLSRQLQSSSRTLELRRLIDLGELGQLHVGQAHSGLAATVGVLDLLRAGAQLANGGRQVSTDLALTIPGVTRSTLTVAIGEPLQHSAWAVVGGEGARVRTSQVKVRLATQVGGTGLLQGATLRLPVYVEAGYADAHLGAIDCSGDGKATIAVTPGLVRTAIADVTAAQLASPSMWQGLPSARIVALPLAAVDGRADVRIGNTSATELTFDRADIDAGTVKRAETESYLASVVTTLLAGLRVEVQTFGLGIGVPSTLGVTVANQLQPLAKPFDDVLHTVLETLGIHLGEADVRLHGLRCGGSALVD